MLRLGVLEKIMRLVPGFVAVAVAALAFAAPVAGQKPDDQLLPRSIELQRQGEAHLAAGRFVEADDALETALAVDPRNRAAFVTLARVAQRQKLFGQAIRFTRKALALEPNDRDALAVQGEAMVELGAVAKARENLAKLQKLCGAGCPQATQLSAAINRGPTVAAVRTPAAPRNN
jgi:Tfp pilus assembly protein PilF